MSYQVLARKWRPRVFSEMVGQEHVLKALTNALDHQRLHHGYLFTGTRGVGKTSVARIFAKCLNCEAGISSTPCGTCGACREIAEGCFLDLIEVDAASRTKVEDTRELLDNVQYAPARGRFKVYLIDEVHMLSSHSFNALLKTLEEPPPHVKFLLATTDPQKLPVTVLSRCLQFNLKNLPPERIVAQLRFILDAEKVPVEEGALWSLARAADGSMRDALSLTDQAIAHGGGKLSEADVGELLGTVDRSTVMAMCQALAVRDPAGVLALVERLVDRGGDYTAALGEMLSIWHHVATAQLLPESVDGRSGEAAAISALADQLSAEDVQLFFQICLLGRRDLAFAPDLRTGFEMVLLRLLAFQPAVPSSALGPVPQAAVPSSPEASFSSTMKEVASQTKKFDAVAPIARALPGPVSDVTDTTPAAGSDAKTVSDAKPAVPRAVVPQPAIASAPIRFETPQQRIADKAQSIPRPDQSAGVDEHKPGLNQLKPEHWLKLFDDLAIGGVLKTVAAGLELIAVELRDSGAGRLRFRLDERDAGLYDPVHQVRLGAALGDYFGGAIEVEIAAGAVERETPRLRAERLAAERQETALRTLRNDPVVRDLVARFDGQLLEDTVVPSDG